MASKFVNLLWKSGKTLISLIQQHYCSDRIGGAFVCGNTDDGGNKLQEVLLVLT